jgi:heme/copper-type cytochrome/quinol oxidase subunit 1
MWPSYYYYYDHHHHGDEGANVGGGSNEDNPWTMQETVGTVLLGIAVLSVIILAICIAYSTMTSAGRDRKSSEGRKGTVASDGPPFQAMQQQGGLVYYRV